MKLYELDSTGIERELEKTADGISQPPAGNAGADPGTNPQAAPMTDPNTGLQTTANEPDAGLGGLPTDIEDEAEETKKISDMLISAVNGMPYVDEYQHDSKSKISPEKIMLMDFDELYNLRNIVTNKIHMISLNDKVGMYNDPGVAWYQNLRDFVDKVLSTKKKAKRPAKSKHEGKTAKFDKRKESKNSEPKKFKPRKPKA